jgi:glutamate carboxypeptidase
MPEELNRAGHLFCELNTGKVKGKINTDRPLDTVFEEDSPFQEFKEKGIGYLDPELMICGDVIIYAALKSLYEAGLSNTQIIIAFTGDEERQDLYFH